MLNVKTWGIIYLCDTSYGTGNLLSHMQKCGRKDTGDVGQLILGQFQGSLLTRTPKFDSEKFHELVIAAILKHDLPFKFF